MDGLFSLIPLIIIFPFVGVLINVFFGRMLMPRRDGVAPGVIATLMAGSSFVIAVLMFIALLGHPEGAEIPFLTWMRITIGERLLYIPWTFKIDTLSSVMMLVVTRILSTRELRRQAASDPLTIPTREAMLSAVRVNSSVQGKCAPRRSMTGWFSRID